VTSRTYHPNFYGRTAGAIQGVEITGALTATFDPNT
jgi:hypothetical protein